MSATSMSLQAVKIISPTDNKRDELRMRICQTYRQVEAKEHQRILQRRKMIEDRKEELENQTSIREQEEMAIQEEQRRKQVEAEMARLEKEAEERERQRRRQEQEDIQKKVAKDRLEQLQKSDIGKAFENVTVDVRTSSI